jgi:hypothetical protein
MATVYITEFSNSAISPGGQMQVPYEQPLAEQTVAIGGSSVQSNAFNAATGFIRVEVDAICSIEINANPTASTTTARLAANQTEYYGVPKGANFKLAVITNT